MKSVIYTAWDGTQKPFTLKRREMIQTYLENIMMGMDPNMALAQMLWVGFPLGGMDFQVMGLKDMLQKIQEQIEQMLSEYSLEKAFDMPLQAIRDLLKKEAQTRKAQDAEPPPEFEHLPPGLLEKIKSLEGFSFLDQSSREIFQSWLAREKDIYDLMMFYSKWVDIFQGDISLNFEEALELMRRVEALEQMAKQLQSGEWQEINPETLRELLGDEAAESMILLLQLPESLSEAGLIRRGKGGLDFTPRGIRAIGEMAFGDLYHMMKRDRQGGYQGNAPQTGEMEPDSSRPFEFGDRFDLDITRTILESVKRQSPAGHGLSLQPQDFHVRDREPQITATLVMLLDLSWSMAWENRFQAAKRVALALDFYIRTKFPKDKFHVVGFSTEARELQTRELALAAWDPGYAFTNLQAGLRLADKLIKRSGNRNNHILVLTDGQPTAYYEGEQLRVEFPAGMYSLSPNAARETLKEVRKVTAQGIQIDTFMLDSNPVLVEFVRAISKINGGRAVICQPGELGQIVMVEEIRRRQKRKR